MFGHQSAWVGRQGCNSDALGGPRKRVVMKGTVETDPALHLVDMVIADLAVRPVRYVGRRHVDGDGETFVIQDGEEGRLRLGRPDLGSPGSVVAMAAAAQSYLGRERGEPTPRCPLHDHALGLAAVDGGFEWVCPDAGWRCRLGDYAEQAWPHFSVGQLAPILGRRLERRGIKGVRSFGVAEGENGLAVTFSAADVTSELVAALTDAAAPRGVEVHQAHRKPRRQVAPVLEAAVTATVWALSVRLLLARDSAGPDGNLLFTVVNDDSAGLLMGVSMRWTSRTAVGGGRSTSSAGSPRSG
jgi:hypothetical protein